MADPIDGVAMPAPFFLGKGIHDIQDQEVPSVIRNCTYIHIPNVTAYNLPRLRVGSKHVAAQFKKGSCV